MQACLIETKDVYERAIGDAPLALEQPYDRGQQRVETPLGVCHALVALVGGTWLACPDQDFAIFIDGKPLPFDELKCEILQFLGIEVELPLERAIGQASSTLEHSNGLVQYLFKAHDAFSLRAVVSKYVCPRALTQRMVFFLDNGLIISGI
jgi:hypothetical protein